MLKKFLNKISSFKTITWLWIFPLAFIITIGTYLALFNQKIYPNVYVLNQPVGGLKKDEAIAKISGFTLPEKIILERGDLVFEVVPNNFEASPDFETTIDRAFQIGRTGNIFYDLGAIISQPFNKRVLGYDLDLNRMALKESLLIATSELSTSAKDPEIFIKNGEISITNGNTGLATDIEKLSSDVSYNLSNNLSLPIEIVMITTGYTLNDLQIESLRTRAQKMLGKTLVVTFGTRNFLLKESDLVNLLDIRNEYNLTKIEDFISSIKTAVERPPQDAVFSFSEGKVQQFKPSLEGIKVNTDTLNNMLAGNLRILEESEKETIVIDLPVTTTQPKIRNEEVNNLGIKELIGLGTSKFAHSIPNRVHNVGLASRNFQGVLIAPGQIFSFNEVLGDVSSFTGYKQAFVIKEGKTVLGDGGGVCQVSTTFFRAALNAGLPIIERKAHSYRVGYYEQDSPPGFDATVFAPSVDLKVENNTGNYILIQTIFDSKNMTLAFELYGTKDGRVATIGKPVTTGVIAPGEDVYIDDPTLPSGTVKQIEYKAWGSKVTFTYKVVRGQETLIDTKFTSNYKPWQAVYLRGTAPIN